MLAKLSSTVVDSILGWTKPPQIDTTTAPWLENLDSSDGIKTDGEQDKNPYAAPQYRSPKSNWKLHLQDIPRAPIVGPAVLGGAVQTWVQYQTTYFETVAAHIAIGMGISQNMAFPPAMGIGIALLAPEVFLNFAQGMAIGLVTRWTLTNFLLRGSTNSIVTPIVFMSGGLLMASTQLFRDWESAISENAFDMIDPHASQAAFYGILFFMATMECLLSLTEQKKHWRVDAFFQALQAHPQTLKDIQALEAKQADIKPVWHRNLRASAGRNTNKV